MRRWQRIFISVFLLTTNSSIACAQDYHFSKCEEALLHLVEHYKERLSGDTDPYRGVFSLSRAHSITQELLRDPKLTPYSVVSKALEEDRLDRIRFDWLQARLERDIETPDTQTRRLQGNLLSAQIGLTYLQSIRPTSITSANSNNDKRHYPKLEDQYHPSRATTPSSESDPSRKREASVLAESNVQTRYFAQSVYVSANRDGTLFKSKSHLLLESRPKAHAIKHEWLKIPLSKLDDENIPLFIPQGYTPLQPETPSLGVILSEHAGEYILKTKGYRSEDLTLALIPEEKRDLSAYQLQHYTTPIGFDRSDWSEKVIRFLENEESLFDPSSNPLRISSDLEQFFSQEFEYLLLPDSSASIPELVQSEQFDCYTAAMAMTSILRDLYRIPTRFRGGMLATIEESGNSVLKEKETAHIWIEVYHKGEWHLFDPTPKENTTEEAQSQQGSSSRSAHTSAERNERTQYQRFQADSLEAWALQVLISEALMPHFSPSESLSLLERFQSLKSRLPVELQAWYESAFKLLSDRTFLYDHSIIESFALLSSEIFIRPLNDSFYILSQLNRHLELLSALVPDEIPEIEELFQISNQLSSILERLQEYDSSSEHQAELFRRFMNSLSPLAQNLLMQQYKNSEESVKRAFFNQELSTYERLAFFRPYLNFTIPKLTHEKDVQFMWSPFRDFKKRFGPQWVRAHRFEELARARMGRMDLSFEDNFLLGTASVRGRRKAIILNEEEGSNVGKRALAVVLLDRSGSMNGVSSKIQEAITQTLALEFLEKGDQVILIPFNHKVYNPIVIDNIDSLRDIFSNISEVIGELNGGTALNSAILHGIRAIKNFEFSNGIATPYAHLMLITDGIAEINPDQIYREAQDISHLTQFAFVTAALTLQNPALEELMAKFTLGHYFELHIDEERKILSSHFESDDRLFFSDLPPESLPRTLATDLLQLNASLSSWLQRKEVRDHARIEMKEIDSEELKSLYRFLSLSVIAENPHISIVKRRIKDVIMEQKRKEGSI